MRPATLKHRTALLWIGVFLVAGCVARQRVLLEQEKPLPVKSAGPVEVLRLLEDQSQAVRTLLATVTLEASGGGSKSGILTEYRETKGYLIVERPDHIRLKAQAPLALATVFDMVSDRIRYRLFVPIKNKFIVGDASGKTVFENPILNLRPKHILDALFVDVLPHMNDPRMRYTVEEATVGRRRFYIFDFIDIGGSQSFAPGHLADLYEKIWIDRSSLKVSRKQIFGKDGIVETDVQFLSYREVDGVSFPGTIVIGRPVEDYTLKITFQRTQMNQQLAEDAFLLEPPPGAELVQADNLRPNSKPF